MRGSLLKRRAPPTYGGRPQSAGVSASAGIVVESKYVLDASVTAAGRSGMGRCASAGRSRPLAADMVPPGMLAAIGESKAVAEMDAQLRGMTVRMRPASAVARLGSRAHSSALGGSVALRKEAWGGERTTYQPIGGIGEEEGSCLEDWTFVRKLGQGASGFRPATHSCPARLDVGHGIIRFLKAIPVQITRPSTFDAFYDVCDFTRTALDTVLLAR